MTLIATGFSPGSVPDIGTPSIIVQQSPASLPVSTRLKSVSNPILPPRSIIRRLSNFGDPYDLSPTSHLVKLMKVFLGDTGTGGLRKLGTRRQLQTILQGSHFFELDGFYGALFGLVRRSGEQLAVDPTVNGATKAQYAIIRSQDASYRSRIYQFARAIDYGATPLGMQLMAEALLSCPCDIFEGYLYDTSPTDVNQLQFTVYPHRPITLEEMHDVRRVLNRIKPAAALLVISSAGAPTTTQITPRGFAASSIYWDITQSVQTRQIGTVTVYSVPSTGGPVEQPQPPFSGYIGETWSYNADIVGMLAYTLDIFGNLLDANDEQRLTFPDGTWVDYPAGNANFTQWEILQGQYASEGHLVAIPPDLINLGGGYYGYLNAQGQMQIWKPPAGASVVTMNGVDVSDIVDALSQPSTGPLTDLLQAQSATNRYWSSLPRAATDDTQDVLECRFDKPEQINWLTFSLTHFPQQASLEYWDDAQGIWVMFDQETIYDSSPAIFSAQSDPYAGNPKEPHPHRQSDETWVSFEVNLPCPGITTSRIRIRIVRIDNGNGPIVLTPSGGPGYIWKEPAGVPWVTPPPYATPLPFGSPGGPGRGSDAYWITPAPERTPAPYELGVQGLTFGYKLMDDGCIPIGPPPIGHSVDLFGSVVTYSVYEERPMDLMPNASTPGPWRCGPQPMPDAVVNFFVDTRNQAGDAQLIDQFYVEPLYLGVHATLYYSNDTPSGSFTASDEWLPNGVLTFFGNIVDFPVIGGSYTALQFDAAHAAYVQIDNTYTQLVPGNDWWLAFDFLAQLPSNTAQNYIDFGGTQVSVANNTLTFTLVSGQQLTAPVSFAAGAHVQIVVGYMTQPSGDFGGGMVLQVVINGGAPQTYQLNLLLPNLLSPNSSTFASGLGGWQALANSTVALGTNAMVLTTIAAGAATALMAKAVEPIAATPGTTYTALATYSLDNLVVDPTFSASDWTNAGTAPTISNGSISWAAGTTGVNSKHSQTITVVPGQVVTIEAYIDATHVTSGVPAVQLYDPAMTAQYGSVAQAPGVAGLVSGQITIPAGVTQVSVALVDSNCVIAGGPLVMSAPLLVIGTGVRTVKASLQFRDAASNILSTITGPAVTLNLTTGPVQASVTAVSPAGTAFVEEIAEADGATQAGQNILVSQAGIFQGTVSHWTPGYSGALHGLNPATDPNPSLLMIGGFEGGTPGVSGMELQALILKQETVTAAAAFQFFTDPHGYVTKGPTRGSDNGTTDNSILRFDPSLITPDHIAGLVGGPPYFYDALSWTPILRDYTLQKGYIQIPPTLAKFFKFEMTNLVAEPYETLEPISRSVTLFSPGNTTPPGQGSPTSTGSSPVGSDVHQALVATGQFDFQDTVNIITQDPANNLYLPNEALTPVDPIEAATLAQISYVYGFQEWQQGQDAPRFVVPQVHTYQISEVPFETKLAFFCGFSAVQAYRLDFEAENDTDVYDEQFYDEVNIASNGWVQNPNDLSTGSVSLPCSVTSKVFGSTHNVTGVQFATQQTPAIQLIPDDDFLDPALIGYQWNDPSSWQSYGDATLVYNQQNNSVTISRTVVIPVSPAPPEPAFGRLVQPTVAPVFDFQYPTSAAVAAANATYGGIQSPVIALSSQGRVYIAYRLTLLTSLTSPVVIELVDANDGTTVLASTSINGVEGQTFEDYFSYDIGQVVAAGTPVFVRTHQTGKSNDSYALDTLSIFDPGIVWEFSVDGGTTFYAVTAIRNNANGVLTFPTPNNQLVWRAIGTRPNMHVNALRIRPLYAGQISAFPAGPMHGPNATTFDQNGDIWEDPMFNNWNKPIPRQWYSAYRNYPTLFPAGAPIITQYSRFYSRPATDTLAAPTDVVTYITLNGRVAFDSITTTDSVSRANSIFKRSGSDALPPPTDSAQAAKWTLPPVNPIVNTQVRRPVDEP